MARYAIIVTDGKRVMFDGFKSRSERNRPLEGKITFCVKDDAVAWATERMMQFPDHLFEVFKVG